MSSVFSNKIHRFCKSSATFNMSQCQPVRNKSAGLIVIGDEILKGQVQDTNTHFLTKNLHQKGIRVSRVSVLPDDIEEIVSEVKTFTKNYDYVLTSGGIGATHDDVTFEAVARAFDCKCDFHPELVDLCKAWFKKTELSEPCFKLAFIPSKEGGQKKNLLVGGVAFG